MKQVIDLIAKEPLLCKQTDLVMAVKEEMFLTKSFARIVVDEANQVIGIITFFDICIFLEKTAKNKEVLRVSELMLTQVPSIHQNEKESIAFSMMRRYKQKFLAVVDDTNHFMGVVRFMTIARRMIQYKQDLNQHLKKSKNYPQQILTA